jgi:hypothetical protein
MCPRCRDVERNKKGLKIDFVKKNLHTASLPMYRALQAILKDGITPGTRKQAREAMAAAETGCGVEC